MITITQKEVQNLSSLAKTSPRLRKNKNYHPELSDTLQRLLNAMEPNTYVQPHKHENPDKREIFVILSGKALIVEFDEVGNIIEHVILDSNSGTYAVEIPARSWHTVLSLEEGTVVFEFKDGPYNATDDKNFATWAPKEGDADCQTYNNNILKQLDIEL